MFRKISYAINCRLAVSISFKLNYSNFSCQHHCCGYWSNGVDRAY